jgi:hypothetical protein
MLKPAPDALAAEIVTLAVPPFVKVMGTEPLLPTSRLPKFTLVGFAESAPCVPVPVRATVGSDALLTIEILPVSTPVAVGSNTAVKLADWPAAKVIGVVIPVKLNPVPVELTCVIVTLALPEFVRVTVWSAALPTASLPKLMLPGLTVNVAPAATPVPTRVSVCGELGALSVNVIVPFAAPATVGAN